MVAFGHEECRSRSRHLLPGRGVAIYPSAVKTYVLASLAAVAGAIVGAVPLLILELGANTSCSDLIQQPALPSCAVPTAASWAVAHGAITGALLAVGATAVASRLRR